MKVNGYKIDIWILIPVLLLMFFSIGAVYSASSSFAMEEFNDANYMFKQHTIRVVLAIGFLFAFARFDYRHFQDIGKWLIWGTVLLLLYIFVGGVSTVKGAARWIWIGPISFQPSDIAKYTLIIYLSALLVRKQEYLQMLYRSYLPLMFYVLMITALVALQPNFSTSLLIFGTAMFMLFNAGVKIKHLAFTFAALIPAAIAFVMSKAYIIGRLTSHAEYSTGGESNYQLNQAIIGFGNGGLFGIGPGSSRQRDFFLPEAHGDFIFSVIGEEYGFIGTFLIILLFTIILIRGYRVSKEIRDPFGKYVSFGITTILTFYAIVNMCVATGITPTTGVPMPFISYGGTALIINSIAAGILLNISSFRNEPQEAFEGVLNDGVE